MEFSELVKVYEQLEKISSRIEMTQIVADFLGKVHEDEFKIVIPFLQGRIFPEWSEEEIGIGNKLVIKAISKISGVSETEIENKIRETGDTGVAAQFLLSKKAQMTLFREKLSVEKVYENLNKLAKLSGQGSQEKKLLYISELLSFAEPLEAKYITRIILEELRLGVGEGIIRDAIAQKFNVSPALVERAFYLITDLGEVARIAKIQGDSGLKKIEITPGRPISVMLAQKLNSIGEALEEIENVAFEIKYDGARIQIHKEGERIKLFTRRLEDVTKQFPEIVDAARKNISANTTVIEGELVAIKSFTDRHPRPFQELSRRIKRKYDIAEMIERIPVEINLFDITFLNGKSLIEKKFSERRKILEKIVKESENFLLAKQLITRDIKKANEFYEEALRLGHEGVMAKNLDAPYQPGSRVGYMYKIKPIMETLDLVIVGATWGEGRRAHWLGSFLLAVLDKATGKFLTIGRMATGFTDEQLQEITELLKDDIYEQIGKEVKLKPKKVVEVAYEEIQRSPTYESGYALRFPRLVRIRDDKRVEDADTIDRVEEILSKG
ncbi:MAG: ATP-dependent DNA ligase [Candidatus Altiarchaeota archaeon]